MAGRRTHDPRKLVQGVPGADHQQFFIQFDGGLISGEFHRCLIGPPYPGNRYTEFLQAGNAAQGGSNQSWIGDAESLPFEGLRALGLG